MKYQIEIEPLASRFVVAVKDPLTGDIRKCLAVNRTAAEMLRLKREGLDIPSISRTLAEQYGAPADRIASDAEALFKKLGLD